MILNIAPVWDEVTVFSKLWNDRLWEAMPGVGKHDLPDDEAIKSGFNGAVEELDPSIVVFYDHGSEGALYGCDGLPMVDYGNCACLSGRIIYTMACSSAAKLGPEAYRRGASSWWGYTVPFSFIIEEEEVFSRLANLGLILKRTKGLSWMDAVGAVKEAYEVEIEKATNPWMIITLINDKNALTCICDENPPDSDCDFRTLGVSMFGKAGQRLTKRGAVAIFLYFVFYSMSFGDYLYRGVMWGRIGFIGMLISSVLAFGEYFTLLSKRG